MASDFFEEEASVYGELLRKCRTEQHPVGCGNNIVSVGFNMCARSMAPWYQTEQKRILLEVLLTAKPKWALLTRHRLVSFARQSALNCWDKLQRRQELQVPVSAAVLVEEEASRTLAPHSLLQVLPLLGKQNELFP
ncbi:hypothetical protein Q9966_000680 [Columba livia]|nr:hypothetical protein Q9966_000680 [Columba livia]